MIDIQHLSKSFGKNAVLNDLSLTVPRNTIYGLLGPNGSGKSTTINLLCGLLYADSGTMEIYGGQISARTSHLIGVVPQQISIYQDLTCRENLVFFARIYGLKRKRIKQRVDDVIDLLSLHEYEHSRVNEMSGGWQRRVNIGVGLVHSPKLLILDEPTAGLDIEARYELWQIIRSLKDSGVCILMTTHQLEEAEKLCTQIGILHHGRIIADGSMSELRKLVNAKQLAVIETYEPDLLAQRADQLGWEIRQYGGRSILLLPGIFDLRDVVEQLGNLPLVSVSLQAIGLEHIYMELTQEKIPVQFSVAG